MKTGKILTGLVLAFLLICAGVFLAARPRVLNPIWNVRLQGHVFADSNIVGQKVWANADTLDTLLISGIDSTATVFLQPLTTIEGIKYSISVNGDSVFVDADSTQGTSDVYNYLVIWRQNYQEGN